MNENKNTNMDFYLLTLITQIFGYFCRFLLCVRKQKKKHLVSSKRKNVPYFSHGLNGSLVDREKNKTAQSAGKCMLIFYLPWKPQIRWNQYDLIHILESK